MRWLKRTKSVAAGFLLAISATAAYGHNPVGTWRVSTGESHYAVKYCQRDKICAKLIWLSDTVKDAKARAYLNRYVVTEAVEIQPDRWSGALQYAGDVYQGLLTVTDDQNMLLKGCKGVFCQTFRLIRINASGR